MCRRIRCEDNRKQLSCSSPSSPQDKAVLSSLNLDQITNQSLHSPCRRICRPCLVSERGGAQFDYEGITACSGDYSAAPDSELLGGSRHTRHTRSDTLFAVCREILPPSDVSYSLFNSASPLTRRRNTEGKSEVPAAGKLLAHPHWSWSGSFPVLSGADFREGPAPEPDMQSAGLQADHAGARARWIAKLPRGQRRSSRLEFGTVQRGGRCVPAPRPERQRRTRLTFQCATLRRGRGFIRGLDWIGGRCVISPNIVPPNSGPKAGHDLSCGECIAPFSPQDKDMDQGGLKRNGNRDDSLTFGETAVGSDTALLRMHLPSPGSLAQLTVTPNGRAATKDQGEFGGLFESPRGQCEGSDMKEALSSASRTPPSWGTCLCPTFSPSTSSRREAFLWRKDLGTYGGHTGGGPCDLDGNNGRLLEDTEIWQDLDLPNSLPEISDFELDSEVAHLDNILHDGSGSPADGLLKESKALVGNGGNCTNVNGTDRQHQLQQHQHQQQQQQQQHRQLLQHQQHQLQHQHQQPPSLLSSVMIKEEKDHDSSFIHIRTPGVVKQEKQENGSFCQSQCLQSTMGSLQGGGPMSSATGVGTGPGYHYKASPSSAVGLQDQKPFGMFASLPPLGESWTRGGRFGEPSGIQRGNDGLPSAAMAAFSVNFSSSSPRAGETSSSAAAGQSKPGGQTHKICLVCSDEASGCHYGVVTCGSCKVFFKRAVEGWRARQNTDGQHNYLCAGRNDCIIDKIRRKNCPACRFRKCLQAGMNLEARKNKKLIKMKVQRPPGAAEPISSMPVSVIPRMPQLVPTMLSVLKAIEPEVIYSGYDSTLPDTSTRLMTTLNRLGGQQVISAVKWAKSLPGFRNLHLDDQMTLLQCSWLFLMSFSLGWRSYEQCNGNMLCFAPDLVINQERMKLPFMNDQCEQMLKICNEFVRLQVSYDEYLCMKVLLLLST
ncbi:unnamed protein product, partial [Pleuronectes platessa]